MVGNGDDLSSWQERFAKLDALPPGSDRTDRQRRGLEFERVLAAMYDAADMEPRSRFRPAGEEIDGSFLYRGRPMLFEAKWTADPVPASALYAFRGKLDGKLSGTLGVFISMEGFAEDAVDALIAGKSLNLLLFDGHDIRKLADPNGIGIEAAIDFKLRAAAEAGTPFVPLPDPLSEPPPEPQAYPAVLVEGSYDAAILTALVETHDSRFRPVFTSARGRLNLPRAALAQFSLLPDVKKLILVADGDGRPEEARRDIELALAEAAGPPEVEVIVIDPDLETALGLVGPGLRQRPPANALASVLKQADLDQLALANRDLASLLRLLGVVR